MVYADTPFVKVLTGIRRCGKSTIMKMLMNELRKRGIPDSSILYYSFDSMEYDDLKNAKLLYTEIKKHLAQNQKTYIFLDEIQEVVSWEKVVNSLMSDCEIDIYVTGSNSRMMSSEISTYLTGRYIAFKIYPLSFGEYLTFKEKYTTAQSSHTELSNYIKLGGFPAVHLQPYSQNEVYTIVKDIYNSTIFTDIVKRNQIRKMDHLERIIKFTFSNVGNSFSAKAISNYLKNEHRSLDNETVYNYLGTLENAYILHRCSRFDIQGKELLKTQEKFYLADPTLRYCILGYSSTSITGILENIVYLELLRRNYDVYVGKLDNTEIDFVATKQGKKIYIQVTEKIEQESTELREYNRLLSIKDNYPKYVLRTDELAGGNYEGIKTMHIADFLLSDLY
jgi:predicted AAA+ superfamily ATPase